MILLETLLIVWAVTVILIFTALHFKMYVFGIAGGFLLLMSAFLLFEPVYVYVGTTQTISPMNITFEDVTNTTIQGQHSITTLNNYEEFTTPYFDLFGIFMQLVCILGGMYIVAECSFKQYNLK